MGVAPSLAGKREGIMSSGRWNRAVLCSLASAGVVALASTGCILPNPAFAICDAAMQKFMSDRNVPGGSLAVVKDGRLVYAQGYGVAGNGSTKSVTELCLFRLASLTKHFTGVGIMQLVERGKLELTTPAFSLLKDLPPLPGQTEDPRIKTITIRELLDHTGGWDRDTSGDPMFNAVAIAQAAGVPSPPSPDAIIRYMRGKPLDFDPGSKSVYSNFGYCILGRVIERVSGLSYEDYMQEYVLTPCGIHQMKLGRTLLAEADPSEVGYVQANEGPCQNVFNPTGALVPAPYGGFCIESMDSHGGWIASTVDVARFEAAMGNSDNCPLLSALSYQTLYAPPAGLVGHNPDGTVLPAYYAGGSMVRPQGWNGKPNYWHNGSLAGTTTYFVRRGDGISWVTLFNQRSDDSTLPDGAIDGAMNDAIDQVKSWPTGDLFSFYP
jgi:N-acyl-D-amino-acid deacylase